MTDSIAGSRDADGFTHVDADGRARMIDVGGKEVTRREAVAEGVLVTTTEVVGLLVADGLKKADALATARIAGIAGSKRTSDLIPLCHPLPIDSVSLDLLPAGDRVRIVATVATSGRTGVEMEALTAVAVAGLTLHDMVKAVDPAASLTDVRLLTKTGGKRGEWDRDAWLAEHAADGLPSLRDVEGGALPGSDGHPPGGAMAGPTSGAAGDVVPEQRDAAPTVRRNTAAVLVASTRGASGERQDTTGPQIADWLASHSFAVDEIAVVADADVATTLPRLLAGRPAVVITTGGTGLSPTDVTPEATAPLLDRPIPGIAEAIRAAGSKIPTAALSRGLAGVANGTVIVNLPGSPGGVRDGLAVLDGALGHLVAQISGGGDHVTAPPTADPVPPRDGHGPHHHEKRVDR